jgi:hypothetical protein
MRNKRTLGLDHTWLLAGTEFLKNDDVVSPHKQQTRETL